MWNTADGLPPVTDPARSAYVVVPTPGGGWWTALDLERAWALASAAKQGRP